MGKAEVQARKTGSEAEVKSAREEKAEKNIHEGLVKGLAALIEPGDEEL